MLLNSADSMRKRIYEIIEIADENDYISRIYDIFMFICILLSILPMCFKNTYKIFTIIDSITTTILLLIIYYA